MSIHMIDITLCLILKPKGHAPVARHGNCKVALQWTLQSMEAEAGQVHAHRSMAALKRRQDVPQLPCVTGHHKPHRLVISAR